MQTAFNIAVGFIWIQIAAVLFQCFKLIKEIKQND